MIITTPLKYDDSMIEDAIRISKVHNVPYRPRRKDSIKKLLEEASEVLVIGRHKVKLIRGNETFSFHPNFSQVRIRRLLNHEEDSMIEAANLTRDKTFLDCTMGLSSDSIIASFVSPYVTALESSRAIYLAVIIGQGKYRYTLEEVKTAVSRLTAMNMNAIDYLKQQPDNSIDVIYFDPMYETNIHSDGINELKHFANYAPLSNDLIQEAKRVARERVVLKAHYKSEWFKAFGFMQCIRKSSVSHYGVIIINS